MTTTQTTAERIADLFDNDGQNRISIDGRSIESVCRDVWHTPDMNGDCTRFEFSDGSAIVAMRGGWDIGFSNSPGCFCWASADNGNHDDDCRCVR